MERESFLLYKSFYGPLKELTLEQKGMLFEAIFDFQINGNDPPPDSPIRMPFLFFKNQFRLDDKKYIRIIERNRKNGSKGGRPKGDDGKKE